MKRRDVEEKMYRGCQVGPQCSVGELAYIQALGANLVRWQIAPFPISTIEQWRIDVATGIERLAEVSEAMPGLTFVADLHKAPEDTGAVSTAQYVLWAWSRIANAVKTRGLSNVKVYGILNEPPVASTTYCREIMRSGIQGVGLNLSPLSPDQKIAVTFPYSDPPHFKGMKPIQGPAGRVWHEVHMYLPLEFTHQGVYPQFPVGLTYPGKMPVGKDGKEVLVDKEWLRKRLAPVRAFQLKHRRKIFVGEFSCSMFADEQSRGAYLRDCIRIFEEYRWHWCYHALFEAPVWAPNVAIQALLTSAWRKNA